MASCLVIDTAPIVRRIARAILTDIGFEVHEAASGRDGIAVINRHSPRIVLVDAALMDMPALDVLRAIRDQAPRTMRGIYCTATFDILDLQRAQAAGAVDVLVKPFDRSTIMPKIDSWVGSTDRDAQTGNYFSRLSRSELVRV